MVILECVQYATKKKGSKRDRQEIDPNGESFEYIEEFCDLEIKLRRKLLKCSGENYR